MDGKLDKEKPESNFKLLYKIIMVTMPTLVSLCMDEFVDQVNIRYAGHMIDSKQLSGIGLA